MTEPMRVLLDSNAFDALAADPEGGEIVRLAIQAGALIAHTTHVQEDEIALAPVVKRLGEVVERVVVPTSIALWGSSRWGMARWSDDEGIAIFERLRGGNLQHTADALIGGTALRDGLVLVTEDNTLRRRVLAEGGQVWTVAELVEWARRLTG